MRTPSRLSAMKIPFAFAVAVASAVPAGPALASPASSGGVPDEVVIPDGTEVTLRLVETLDSATASMEDIVRFEVDHDVVVDGVKVIARGAPGRGRVTRAQHRRSFGRKGKLDFAIEVVEAVDGSNVRLRASRELRGKDLHGTAAVVTILTGPFGILVKGREVEVPAGTLYTIYIDGERKVSPPPADAGAATAGGR